MARAAELSHRIAEILEGETKADAIAACVTIVGAQLTKSSDEQVEKVIGLLRQAIVVNRTSLNQ
jgi:hypothetical protein